MAPAKVTTAEPPRPLRDPRPQRAVFLLLLALLAFLPAVGLISSRPRSAAEPPGEHTVTPEHEPPPSTLVAPRPLPAGARAPDRDIDARDGVARRQDAGRATETRPASTIMPEQALLELQVLEDGHAAQHSWIELGLTPAGSETETLELVQADAQGLARLALEPGSVRAVAWGASSTALPVFAELAAGERRTLELVCQPAWPVAGRVVDAESGAPLADATVSFWTFAERDTVRSGPDGSFVHPRFPSGAPAQQVRATKTGHGPAVRYLRLHGDGRWKLSGASEQEPDQLGQGTPWIELALVPELTVRGRVADEQGRAIAGARVSLEGYFRVLPSVASRDGGAAESASSGAFAIGGLRSDIGHALSVEAPGFAQETLELEQGDGRELDLGTLVLRREALLAGVVIDAAGQPVEDVEVVLEPLGSVPAMDTAAAGPGGALDVQARFQGREWRVRTDATGTFLFEHLTREEHRVLVQRDRDSLAECNVVPRADGTFPDLALELLPASLVLEGTVSRAGRPVPGARVELRRFGSVGTTTSDPSGRFRVSGLDGDAAYEICASFRGETPGELLRATASAWAFERPVLALEAVGATSPRSP